MLCGLGEVIGSLWAPAFSSVNGSRMSTLLVTGRVSWGTWVYRRAQLQLPWCSEWLGWGTSGQCCGEGRTCLPWAWLGFGSSALPLLVPSRASPLPSLALAQLRGCLLQAVFPNPNACSGLKGSLTWAGLRHAVSLWGLCSCLLFGFYTSDLTSSSPSSRAGFEHLLSAQEAALPATARSF